jgi:hypothetical protein
LIVLGFNQLRGLAWLSYVQAAGSGLLIYPFALIAQGIAWSLLIGGLTRDRIGVSWFDIRIFALSQLMKRLPGGIWYVAGRVSEYLNRGVAAKVAMAASGVELSLIGVASAALFVSLTYLRFGPLLTILGSAAIATLAGCAAGLLAARARSLVVSHDAPRNLGQSARTTGSLVPVLVLIGALYVVSVVCGAAILEWLANAGAPHALPFDQALRLWSLIAAIGAVIAVVPFGIGLRDLTVVSVLSVALTPAEAIVTAAFFRVVLMVGDVVWGAIIWLLARWLSRLEARPRTPAMPAISQPGPNHDILE